MNQKIERLLTDLQTEADQAAGTLTITSGDDTAPDGDENDTGTDEGDADNGSETDTGSGTDNGTDATDGEGTGDAAGDTGTTDDGVPGFGALGALTALLLAALLVARRKR